MEEVSFPRGRPAQDIPEADKSDKPKRGRSSERSSTDKKRSTVDSADFLFGGGATEDKARSVSSKRKKAKTTEKASSSGASQSLLPLGGGGVVHPTNKEAWIEPLSFSKLAKGFKLLGCVRAVHDDLVIFSLPNMWTGYMLLDDSRKKNGPGHEWSCRQMVQPGQILSVIILKAVQEDNKSVAGNSGPRRRIQVTCVPAKMNPLEMSSSTMTSVRGQVISVEDHGLLVDLGMTRRGFLPFSEIDGEYTTEDDDKADNIADANKRLLRAGSIHDFTVRSGGGADAKIVPLSMSSKVRGAKQFLPSTHTPTLAALQPGTLVHAKVERVVRNGLCVSFGGDNGVFRGAIEVNHLGSLWVPENKHESIEWKTIFETNRSLTARIVAVDPITKIVRLSLMQHILDLKEPPALPAVGCIFEGATVIRLDPGVGALLALPDRLEEDAMPKRIHKLVSVEDAYGEATRVQAVYVHISKAIDERSGGKTPEATFSKEFAPSTKHSVRILSTSNWIDGIASGATSDSVISAHVLTHADLLPGKVYHNVPVCAQLNGGAILVDFGLGVRGLIPPLHLFDQAATSDFRTKMGKVKYAVGAKVDVRVLSVDVESKRCVVSAKKSLLKADDVILSYDNIKLGDKGTGFISKVDDRGLSVTFFGGVYGRVTARSLVAELGVEDHKENYNAGDVVQCRIVNIKKRKSRNLGQDDMDVDEADDSRAYWELTLSLGAHSDGDMQLEPDTLESSKSSQAVSLCAGAILPLKSLRIVELVAGREKEKGYVPGHAIVRIKSKYLVEVESEAMLPYIECKLPYDQLLDQYDDNDVESAASLDALADKLLTVGKKIDREGLVMTDPRKSRAEYSSATGKLTVVSIRPKLVNAAKVQLVIDEEKSSKELILPRPDTQLYMGAKLLGYVAQVDARFGAFVRFLDGMTGLVPKLKGGNDMKLFSTVETQIIALDVTTRPVKILLSLSRSKSKKKVVSEVEFEKVDIHVGDLIDEAQVNDLDFHRAKLQILDSKWAGSENIRARVHCTMAESKSAGKLAKTKSDAEKQTISVVHPFYKWKTGMKLSDLTVVAVDCRAGIYYIELTNRKTGATSTEASGTKSQPPPFFFASASKLVPSQKVSGIVSSADQRRGGLWINLSPGVSGFLPGLELSLDPKVLNNLEQAFPVGSRLECSVLDKMAWIKLTAKLYGTAKKDEKKKSDVPLLSLLHDGDDSTTSKPIRGDLVVGRISNSLQALHAPALMFELRGGYVGRCCITEVDEVDDWVNMPLGRVSAKKTKPSGDLDGMDVDASDGEDDEQDLEEISGTGDNSRSPYPHGTFVLCRVLAGVPSKPLVDVSLRTCRIEGDLDDDAMPEVDETTQAYVVSTNKKGCFLRLGRQIEGRVILKELCDGFLPDPAASFPMGRLVVGKIKAIQKASKKAKGSISCKFTVDLDMRETVLLDTQKKLKFEEVELGDKHKGTVTRIEDYGVFVRLENSDLSGLVHKSECSDNYIKDLAHLYDPGDLVKVLVLKKDAEKKQFGFSMKASHFENDEDSDDDEDASLADNASEDGDGIKLQDDEVLDSDDENFASKLAIQMEKEGEEADSEAPDGSDSESEDDDSSSDDDSDEGQAKESNGLDTNVGFDWGGPSSAPSKLARKGSVDDDEDSSDEEDNEDAVHKSSHKSRRKQAQRRREEQETSRREIALADGTADDNPETTGDFERLLAGSPNSSEIWIRYMAFHLTLADIPAAREVAERAFKRIEFRQEREKLNVWCALLTLELKYGSSTSLQDATDRACQHNNPKQVYLRVSEIMEREISPSSPESIERADELFRKMCKKFKDKKQVWIAHVQYLLRSGRHEEAHALSKRALESLPSYKHVETMSKFAQLVFEYGTAERARTLFDGLLLKHQKRLDIFFVYVDKEVKHGEIDSARSLFQRAASPRSSGSMMKLADKQMKSLFKKWYSFEEQHGDDETQERVKNAAREYVERSSR